MLRETQVYGQCMRTFGWSDGEIATYDDAASIVSGDDVRVHLPQGWIIKRLVTDAAGRWALQCSDGIIPLSHYSVVPLSELAKIVSRRPLPERERRQVEAPQATAKDHALFAALASIMGPHVAGVPWPGLDAALPAFTLPADFDERYRCELAVRGGAA